MGILSLLQGAGALNPNYELPYTADPQGQTPISPAPAAPVQGGPPIPQAQAPSVPHGILGRVTDFANGVGRGISQETAGPAGHKALRAFGAAMLGAPNFWQGLSQGTQAFDATKTQEEAEDRGKTQFLADGAFQAHTDRLGNVNVTPNQPVVDYEREQAKTKIDGTLAAIGARNDGQLDVAGVKSDTQRQIAESNRASREQIAASAQQTRILVAGMMAASRAANGQQLKPMPGRLQTIVDGHIDNAYQLRNTVADIDGYTKELKTSGVQFDPVSRLKYQAQLQTGINVTPAAVAYGNFTTMLEQMRNAKLLMNKGVQTEGDAQRALNEIVASKGSTDYVLQRMNILKNSFERDAQQHDFQASRILKDNGRDGLESPQRNLPSYGPTASPAAPKATPAPKGLSGGAVKITGNADWVKLKAGQHFIGPDGKERVK